MSDKLDEKLDRLVEATHELDKNVAIMSNTLSEHVKQDQIDLERLNDSLHSIDNRLGEYNTQLDIHIAGVLELRKLVQAVREENDIKLKDLELRIKEAEKPAIVAKGVLWLVGAATAIALLISKLQGLL
jgi:ABC-type transport system involved in cytochrome bd biosynthesis fused ATPase/permease subunit